MGAAERANPLSNINRPLGVLDARGRKLEIGDEIILHTPRQQYMRIVDIKPILDPKAPPGLYTVVFGMVVNFNAPQGIPQGEFIRVRTAEEAGPSPMVPLPTLDEVRDPGSAPKEG